MFTQNAGLDDFLDGVSDGLEASSHNFASLLINTHIGKDEEDKETRRQITHSIKKWLVSFAILINSSNSSTSRQAGFSMGLLERFRRYGDGGHVECLRRRL